VVTDETPSIRYFNDENLTAQAALSGQGIAFISQLARRKTQSKMAG